jgi:GrpB-like predicted nucleotidyltransferase (UPF0157 family)
MQDSLVLVGHESSDVAGWFSEVAAHVEAGLPGVDVEHVGSTAVPGCLAKGDLDVLVRVPSEAFHSSMEVLDGLLARSPRNDPTDDYVEYDYMGRGFTASVQLAVVDGWHDRRFHGLKALLKSDPRALERYNGVKREHEGRSMEEYRRAKALLIKSLLAGTSG